MCWRRTSFTPATSPANAADARAPASHSEHETLTELTHYLVLFDAIHRYTEWIEFHHGRGPQSGAGRSTRGYRAGHSAQWEQQSEVRPRPLTPHVNLGSRINCGPCRQGRGARRSQGITAATADALRLVLHSDWLRSCISTNGTLGPSKCVALLAQLTALRWGYWCSYCSGGAAPRVHSAHRVSAPRRSV